MFHEYNLVRTWDRIVEVQIFMNLHNLDDNIAFSLTEARHIQNLSFVVFFIYVLSSFRCEFSFLFCIAMTLGVSAQ